MARAATSPELALYRSPNKRTILRAAIHTPTVIWRGRINQSFATLDGVLEITYDNGDATTNVRDDMEMFVGSSLDAYDVGIVRVRSIDGSKVYIEETSDVEFANDQYLTIVDAWALRARHVRIVDGVPYMDGGIAYSDQHADFDPITIAGPHKVFKLTGASVADTRDLSRSYVVDGSSVTGYLTGAPTATSVDNNTTATPTININATGWHRLYFNSQTATKNHSAVRFDYVWSDDDPPPRAQIGELRGDVDEGGWACDITLLDDVDLATVHDRALVIIFGEDYYGSTQSDIGPEEGSENIYFIGWIAKESIIWNPEQGSVRFTAYTAHYWLSQIPAYPDGVELVARPPAAWTEVEELTVNKGLFHFLRWRTTATKVMDVFLTDDSKYTKEVSSLAQNLWEQLREMAFLQIFARAGCNALNQLYIEVHPQLVPEGSRDWPTVMTITEADWVEEIPLERVVVPECAQVNLSGVLVNESGAGSPFFSLSPGHTYTHYGRPEIQDQLLVSSQAQSNSLAGLYFGWRNNPYPDIPVVFDACIRLIDLVPRQQCAITIEEADTPRGIAFTANLVPRSMSIIQDPETGYVHSEVSFEAETFEAMSVNGDVPGSDDISVPPVPSLPDLPPLPVILPGTGNDEEEVSAVIMHDIAYGLLFTSSFQDASPNWITVNAGLTEIQYQSINQIVLTPSGGIYVAARGQRNLSTGVGICFIAYASQIGGTFTVFEDHTTLAAKFPAHGNAVGVNSIAINPLTGQIGYAVSAISGAGASLGRFYIGSGTSFSAGVEMEILATAGSLSYGFGNWRLINTRNIFNTVTPRFIVLSSGGGSIVRDVAMQGQDGLSATVYHVPISTTDEVISVFRDDGSTEGILRITDNGAVAGDFTTVVGDNLLLPSTFADNRFAVDPTGLFMMGFWGAGARGKSSDGGATWVGIPNLPVPGGPYAYAYAGGSGASSRWVAALAVVRYSDDFGTTWINKEGNLTSIVPLPNINIVRAVGF